MLVQSIEVWKTGVTSWRMLLNGAPGGEVGAAVVSGVTGEAWVMDESKAH